MVLARFDGADRDGVGRVAREQIRGRASSAFDARCADVVDSERNDFDACVEIDVSLEFVRARRSRTDHEVGACQGATHAARELAALVRAVPAIGVEEGKVVDRRDDLRRVATTTDRGIDVVGPVKEPGAAAEARGVDADA